MRSQSNKSVSRRTPNRTLPLASPAAIVEERPAGQFSLCWRDRSGRVNRRSFETAHDLMAALERLRRHGDIHVRDRRVA